MLHLKPGYKISNVYQLEDSWIKVRWAISVTRKQKILQKDILDSFNSFQKQILDSSILKEFADDNSKFDENGRKFCKWVENAVGKGEIARYEQFLLFPQCFQKRHIKTRACLGKG